MFVSMHILCFTCVTLNLCKPLPCHHPLKLTRIARKRLLLSDDVKEEGEGGVGGEGGKEDKAAPFRDDGLDKCAKCQFFLVLEFVVVSCGVCLIFFVILVLSSTWVSCRGEE